MKPRRYRSCIRSSEGNHAESVGCRALNGSLGLGSTAALACGDKLVLTLGNLRFRQVNESPRPAAILAYTPRNSLAAGVVKELERQSAGKRVGLTFYSLDDPARLDAVLRAKKYDLLLVDAGDVDSLERHAESVPSKPVVLPVVFQSSKSAAAEAEKKFHCVLRRRILLAATCRRLISHGVHAENAFEKGATVVGQKGSPRGVPAD